MTRYLLDTNIFVEGKKRHFGFDFCPAFWDWVLHENREGRVFSVRRVRDELLRHEDELAEWADARGEEFFLPESAELFASLGKLSQWVSRERFDTSAKEVFFDSADYYLVGHAQAFGFTVVTHERPDVIASKKRVKIPNACVALNVPWMAPWPMLGQLGAKFVLG